VLHEEIEYSPYIARVYEYNPAPGQFVNKMPEYEEGDTYADMTRKAEESISGTNDIMITLGGYGGYVTFGFDHTVINIPGEADFRIWGNCFYELTDPDRKGGSAEPGIVMVSYDTNCNGLPDDEWFELKGSESGKPETRQRHAVRYTRPTAPHSATHWESIDGERGTVDYLASFHNQEYYYPLWVEASAMTLYGTRLASRVLLDTDKPMEYWVASPYGWGYADNYGCDRIEEWTPSDDPTLTPLSRSRTTYHSLSNAVTADGSPADLQWIDFVKIQTAVLDKCGHLGEISTEIERVTDNTMK